MASRVGGARRSPQANSQGSGAQRRTPKWGRIAGALAVVVLVVAVVVALLAGGGDDPPAAAATDLVPAGALAYVHLSTDEGRGATKDAADLARSFPAFPVVRDTIVGQVSAPQCGVDLAKLRGKEVALALLPGGGTTAGSLLLVDSGKDEAGVRTRACGQLTVTSIGRFVAVGQAASLDAARQLARGQGTSLAEQPDFVAASAKLPANRAVDGWASQAGVRRLLEPQAGLLGAAGALLDRPGLRGAAFGLAGSARDARLTLVSRLDPGTTVSTFTPQLTRDVPAGALAYLGTAGVTGAAERLLGATGSSSGVTALLGRAGAALARQTNGALQRDVLGLLRGEVAVSLSPRGTGTVLTLQARARDEAATRRTLRSLEPTLARLLTPEAGSAPRWTASGDVRRLQVAQGVELDYAVADGRLLLATQPAGIQAALDAGDGLPSTDGFRDAVGDVPDNPLSTLGFLDFQQVLRLAEGSGLDDNRAYQAVRADLRRIAAVGLTARHDGDDSIAELHLSIP